MSWCLVSCAPGSAGESRRGLQDKVLSNSAPHTTRLSAVLRPLRAEPSVTHAAAPEGVETLATLLAGDGSSTQQAPPVCPPHILISGSRETRGKT